MDEVRYRPIGYLRTPFSDLAQMPIQPTGETSAAGTAEILPEFAEGLKDLGGFSHVILIYHLHEARRASLSVKPFLDSESRGVFATRAPTRPNPIGLSVVELRSVEGTILHLANLDMLDGTPLLDIKPYVPEFDRPVRVRIGWLEKVKREVRTTTSDDRFA